MTLRKTN